MTPRWLVVRFSLLYTMAALYGEVDFCWQQLFDLCKSIRADLIEFRGINSLALPVTDDNLSHSDKFHNAPPERGFLHSRHSVFVQLTPFWGGRRRP